jgi:glyoxylase-like metal-dependent hydrolase (beta-lactamase superfamily II)
MRALLLIFALAACATHAPPADGYAYIAESVAPHVTAVRQGESFHVQPRGNVVIIEQRAGVVLIDSGGSPSGAEEVIAAVRSRTRKPVTAIVLTHWHGDHVLGAARLMQEWPHARLIATAPTAAHLADPRADRFMPGDNPEANAALQENIAGAVAYLRDQSAAATIPELQSGYAQAAADMARYRDEMRTARRVVPAETFAETMTLPDPDAPILLRFIAAANTDGDAIAWLPRQRVLVTGDVVVAPIPYGFGSAPAHWIAVLEALRTYDFAVLVPGHGAPTRGASYLNRLIALLAAVVERIAPLAAQGPEARAAAGRLDLARERAGFVGDDPWLGLWFDRYFTDAIAAGALHEIRGEPTPQLE